MQVLLKNHVANLGQLGDLVRVKPGYARNFLFPRGLAILADESRRKEFEHNRRSLEEKKQRTLSAARELAARVTSVTLTINKQVGEEEKIFGTVTHAELADAFKAQGFDFDRRHISLKDDIKKLGIYQGSVKVHPEVAADFKVWVVAKS